MPPAKVRVRHPRGVTTLDLEPDIQTVEDLKVLLFSATEIPPSQQEIKYGYPPKPLPDSDGVLASIPITKGEQIIVTSRPEPAAGAASISAGGETAPTPAPSVKALNDTLSAPKPPPSGPPTPGETSGSSSDSVALPNQGGHLILRVIPDDNSCLFSSVGLVFEGSMTAASKLRQGESLIHGFGGSDLGAVVADAIRADPIEYSDVMLGQPREQYIRKISSPDAWGGAIELSIFAKHYKTEISSFDVATGRCDRFAEGQYPSRCLLVYSGIHYDALTLAPMMDAPPDFHTTVFPVADQTVLQAAVQLVEKLKSRHYYTDTANFDLRCGVCGTGLRGEKGARDHAMQTGHVEFGEY